LKVLLDTNILMAPEQLGLDVFSELERLGYLEWLVPQPVIEELSWLSEHSKKGRDRRAARVGLGLAARCARIPGYGEADDILETLAVDLGAAVLTSDRELKKRLSRRGITVIYPRQSRYLEIAMQKEY